MKMKWILLSMIMACLTVINGHFPISQALAEEEQQEITDGTEVSETLSSTERAEADAVLEKYFKALTNGDTKEIKKILEGSSLLEKREKLLDNPIYSDFLQEIYREAQFEIQDYRKTGEDKMQADVDFILNEQETVKVTFTLKKKTLASDPGPSIVFQTEKEKADHKR